MKELLSGKKVAVLIDTEYIHEEAEHYKTFFTSCGAEVEFLSYLWGAKERKIICDITDAENPEEHIHTMRVNKDIASCNPNDYAIILVAANYVACRLREIPPMHSLGGPELLRTAPAVQFIAGAMMNKTIVKGALCHGLWLLTPVPELLKGRKVICHTVVLADVVNAGAVFVPEPSHVVIDDDLVTGRSAADLEAYTNAVMEAYRAVQSKVYPC
jgi:protease I